MRRSVKACPELTCVGILPFHGNDTDAATTNLDDNIDLIITIVNEGHCIVRPSYGQHFANLQ